MEWTVSWRGLWAYSMHLRAPAAVALIALTLMVQRRWCSGSA